jgi:hypothetical protein
MWLGTHRLCSFIELVARSGREKYGGIEYGELPVKLAAFIR